MEALRTPVDSSNVQPYSGTGAQTDASGFRYDEQGFRPNGMPGAMPASSNSPLPQFQPQQVAQSQALPDAETMRALFRSPMTRDFAISIAKRAYEGGSPQETYSTFEREDGSVWQINNLNGQLNRVAEGQDSPEFGFTNVGGNLIRTNAQAGTAEPIFQAPETAPNSVREYDRYAEDERAAGREPLGRLEYEQSLRRSGASNTTVTVDNAGSGEFFKTLDKSNADMFGGLLNQAPNAQSNLARIDRLDGMLQDLGPGWLNNVTMIAGNLGIDIGNAGGVQGTQALINAMVPEQRQPGSGPMSDADLELFKQSLPRIINSPEGNQQIIQTLRGISQYQLSQSDIAARVASREITPEQGNQMLRTLPNPLEWLRGAELPAPISAPLQEGGSIPTLTSQEQFDALPSGTEFRAPDGSIRRKP